MLPRPRLEKIDLFAGLGASKTAEATLFLVDEPRGLPRPRLFSGVTMAEILRFGTDVAMKLYDESE